MIGIVLRTFCLGIFLFFNILGAFAQVTVSADEPDAFYEANEAMNFEVSANFSASATYQIYYDKFTTPLTSGSLNISAGQTSYIPFTLNEPGVVFCEVTQGGTKTTAVAAFSPYDIEQLEPEPADFDAFWDQKKAELAAVSMDPNLTYYSGNTYATTYKIDLAQIDGRRVYGYISIPTGTGPFPAILELPAYGSGANTISPGQFLAERGGAISMKISIHNGPLNQGDPNAYQPDEIDDADNIYIRYGVLAALRSIDYIFSRDDFDGESMGVVGVSQGGALSMMVAGIDDRIKLLSYAHPAYCEHAGLPNDKASGFPFYVNTSRGTDGSTAHELATIAATRYYDVINFLKRYDGPSLGFIGYKDEISLASGIFAAYNGLSGPSILLHEIEIGHSPMPNEYWDGRYDFFRRHFPAMANPPWPFPDETTGYGIDAGADASIQVGTTLNLSGEAYDNENLNTSWPVKWEMISGPGSVSFGNSNTANTTATFSTEGTYVLRFSVTDYGLLNSISKYYRLADQIEVVVGSGGGSSYISLNCPADINQILPEGSNSISVNWNTPFPSGNCQSGASNVTQIAGPTNGASLTEGTYTVTYQATDNCNNNTNCSFEITIESGTVVPDPANYCEATGIAPWFEWISAVNFEQINNVSSKESYGDFTNFEAEVNIGESYPISITAAFSWQLDDVYVRAWIDYNSDNVFQESEETVFSAEALVTGNGGAASTVLNGTVSIPSDAVVGSTRMRVALQRDAYATPCETFQFGEVEDYTININQGSTPTELTITCPQNIAITAPQGSDEAVVNWSTPNTFSTCSTGNISLTQTQGLSSGSSFPEGNTTISYIAFDACGNNETCSFIITVTSDNDQPPSTNYCESQSDTPWNEWISNVSIEQINNSSSKTTYSDFTDEVANLEQGSTFSLDITTGYSWQSEDTYLRVWIDYNQDNIFQEPSEVVLSEVLEAGNGGATARLSSTTLNVPANATVGNTRMRVSLKRDAYADPCESFAFGEVEDYGINISAGSNETLIITCPDAIQVVIPAGQSDISVSWNTPDATTTCSGNSINLNQTQGASSGSSFTEGTYQISYEVTDNCNNTEVCTFTITVTTETSSGDYCESQGNTPWTEWLERVAFQEINNNSLKTQYSDFTNLIANVEQGETATLNVQSGFSWQSYDTYLRVWIDYNQDGVFQEPAEIVLSDVLYIGNGGATAINSEADVSIPSDATVGQTRMRVALKRDAFADPCESFAFGEVEDYGINISAGSNETLSITCPDAIQVAIPAGQSDISVSWNTPDATTTCSGNSINLNQTQGASSGSSFTEGTYQISYEATDNCNNTEVCTFTITVSTETSSGDYCESQGNTPWTEWLERVAFQEIDNNSLKTQYSDFTNLTANVEQGETATLSVTSGFSWQSEDVYLRAWIDYNQDGVFQEPAEIVLSDVLYAGNGGATAVNSEADVSIPSDATIGQTRMRVALKRDAFADPCESFAYGEVEDYGINISAGSNETLSITCPDAIQVAIPAGQSDISVSWNTPDAATTCLGNSINLNQTQGASSGSSFTEGTYQISYEATDNCNNTEVCTFTITVTTETSSGDYCESQGNTPWTEWLERVAFQEIDNNSLKTQYSDFTNLTANVEQGATATLNVQSGFSWQSYDTYLRVWIDYNQDGVFQEPAEIVLSDVLYAGNGGATAVNSEADVSIPSDATIGQTRMRVALKRDAFADPCESFAYGEVEDYTIIVNDSGEGLQGSGTEFLFLTAAKENGVSVLNWDCNSTDRTNKFEVERSINQIDFVKISETTVALNTIANSHYVTTDDQPKSGENFYRIKQIFNDGSIKYSSVRKLEYPVFDKAILVFPNPAINEIYIQLSAYQGESVSIELNNILGVNMMNINVDNCTTRPFRIDLSNFKNGMYNISVVQNSGKRKNQWFVLERLD